MRESLNRFIYDTRTRVNRFFRITTGVSTFVAAGLIIYIIGFPQSDTKVDLVRFSMDFIFGIFALSYFVKLIYSFERIRFIKDTWFQAIIMSLIVIFGVNKYVFSYSLLEVIYGQMSGEHAQIKWAVQREG